MHNVLYDPLLLMLPAETTPRSEIEVWFESIETWAFAHGNIPYHEYHLRDLVEKHIGHEHIPSFTTLRNLQQRYQLDVSLPTISTLITEVFFQDTGLFFLTLENHLAEHDLIVEPIQDTLAIQPCALTKRWPIGLSDVTISLLAETGVGKSKGEPFSSAVVLATLPAPSTTTNLSSQGMP
ncbi:MAG TPA: hypothetical protein VKR06_25070 [Ktedonosporobacter sp.]|nr:hypothetical protein [Ktedonosporobacter sp.]